MDILVNFDGAIVQHDNGGPVPYALEILRKLQDHHNIILNTCRGGELLHEAIQYLSRYGIELYGVNINPLQKEWTDSTKAYGDINIDSKAVGCPLATFPDKKPYIDWIKLNHILESNQLIDT